MGRERMGKTKTKQSGHGEVPNVLGRGQWRMVASGLATLVILVGTVTWLLLAGPGQRSDAGQARGGPRISVDKELIDFGTVPFRKYVEAGFRIRNVGDQPLTLPANPPLDVLEGC